MMEGKIEDLYSSHEYTTSEVNKTNTKLQEDISKLNMGHENLNTSIMGLEARGHAVGAGGFSAASPGITQQFHEARSGLAETMGVKRSSVFGNPDSPGGQFTPRDDADDELTVLQVASTQGPPSKSTKGSRPYKDPALHHPHSAVSPGDKGRSEDGSRSARNKAKFKTIKTGWRSNKN